MTAVATAPRRRAVFRLKGPTAHLPLVLLVALRFIPGVPTSVAYAALAVFALMSRTNAILALVLSWLFVMANPGLVGDSSGSERYLVLFGASVSVVIHGLRDRVVRPDGFVAATMVLVGFLVGHSLFLSPMVGVSILKALSWGLAMLASLLAWLSLDDPARDAAADRVFGILMLVTLASLPLLVAPVGYLRNGSGFQGILNHPQAFGLAMATFTTWSAARLLRSAKPSWLQVVLTGIGLILVVLSEARTAGVALVIGSALGIAITIVVKARRLRRVAPALMSRRFWSLGFLGLLGALGALDRLWSTVQDFLMKRSGGGGSLLDLYDTSRGTLIDLMIVNIVNDPWRGIGFGIASVPSLMVVEQDRLFGLPISAAIEKGIAPLAVLEEVGIMGLVLFLGWIAWLGARAAHGGLASLAVLLTILALNFGESTLFSAGGHGLLGIVLMGWVYAEGRRARG